MQKKHLLLAATTMIAAAGLAADARFFEAAVIPEATLLYQVDASRIAKDTPISQKISRLRDAMAENDSLNEVLGGRMQAYATFLEVLRTFQKELEIEEEDVVRMQSTVCLKTLTFGQGKTDPTAIDGLTVMEFSKPVNLNDIAKAASRISANQGLVSEAVADTAAGVPMQKMNAVVDPATNAVITLAFALPDPATPTVMYVGQETSLRAALERFSTGQPAALPEALATMKQQIPGDAAVAFLFSPTDTMRDLLRTRATAPNQAPAFAMTAKTLAEMPGVAFHAAVKEKIDLRLAFNMRTAEDAAIFKNVADGMVIASLKMMVMQKIGRPTPLTESMQSTVEGSCVAITAAITGDDLDIFSAGSAAAAPAGQPLGVPAQ